MDADVETFLLLLPVLLLAMALHELAHGWVAWKLGDPTARLLGRLTLNPIRHLDPLGTAMFAITWFASIGIGSSPFVFGWAKPIPVQPRYFREPRRGMAIVAIAGPAVNLAVAAGAAALLVHARLPSGLIERVAVYVLSINVVLAVFNMLPIPPLDGSRVVGAILGDAAYRRWSALDRYGLFVLVGLFVFANRPFTKGLGDLVGGGRDLVVRAVGG